MSSFAERLRIQPQEVQLFTSWFRELSGGGNRIPAQAAAGFLKKSELPKDKLKQTPSGRAALIW
eukprot:350652-Rhodomonas_salina.1